MTVTEIVLNGILNLFALQAATLPEAVLPLARKRAASYLRDHLGLGEPAPYLALYDTVLEIHHTDAGRHSTEQARSVASGLRSSLARDGQYQVVVVLADIEALGEEAAPSAVRDGVIDAFEIPRAFAGEYAILSAPSFPWDGAALSENFLLPGENPTGSARVLRRPLHRNAFAILRTADGPLFLRSSCSDLQLDGAPLPSGSVRALKPGSVLCVSGDRIHFPEIAAAFSAALDAGEIPVLRAEGLDFRYPGSDDAGLHDFSFSVSGGNLVAIMGGSGSGKTTLLSLLTGKLRPRAGRLLLNGRDVTDGSMAHTGILGYVPQDDLLFEDLTVFDNLYYCARLSLPGLDDAGLRRRCLALLDELNQLDIAEIRVGSPLDKTISGGQRKRLNIALELIREPAVLLVDEPTSGLSSADSANVVSLLKAQTARGKIVIAVIHQPSGEVFRMFDRLWMLDAGGRPIFDGNPLDALVYFRTASYRAGNEEFACPRCGHVNPEQIFDIVEERTVDARGFPTRIRKTTPEEWNRLYVRERERREAPGPEPIPAESASAKPAPAEPAGKRAAPSLREQFAVFFLRTARSRIANTGYRMAATLEPLILALAAGFLFRGFRGAEYVFRNNANVPGYFFISAVIAVFLGMVLAADEINGDRKILERERLLGLDRRCYLASKAFWLLLVCGLQTGLYATLGNLILEVPSMGLWTWIILFSTSVSAAMLGLILSDAIPSPSAIHIMIPVLLAPQIILGGAVIPFDDLLPSGAGNRNVPIIADVMPTRWAYEALMVQHYRGNPFNAPLFGDDTVAKRLDFLIGVHLPELRGLASYPFVPSTTPDDGEIAHRLSVLRNELDALSRETGIPWRDDGVPESDLTPDAYTKEIRQRVFAHLKRVERLLKTERDEAVARRNATEDTVRKRLGNAGYDHFMDMNFNKETEKRLLGITFDDRIVISGSRLVSRVLPIATPPESCFGRAHLFAPFKRLGDRDIPTPAFDVGALWLLSALFYGALSLRVPERAARFLTLAFSGKSPTRAKRRLTVP